MLYHAPDLSRTLRQLPRVLTPDGVFVAATASHEDMRAIWAIQAESI